MRCGNPRIRTIRSRRCMAFDLILVTSGGFHFPSSATVFDLQCHLSHASTNSRRQIGDRWRTTTMTTTIGRGMFPSDLRLGLQWHFTLNAGPSDSESCDCIFRRLLRRNSFEANHPRKWFIWRPTLPRSTSTGLCLALARLLSPTGTSCSRCPHPVPTSTGMVVFSRFIYGIPH